MNSFAVVDLYVESRRRLRKRLVVYIQHGAVFVAARANNTETSP